MNRLKSRVDAIEEKVGIGKKEPMVIEIRTMTDTGQKPIYSDTMTVVFVPNLLEPD